MARLWVYRRGTGWYDHIDWQDGTLPRREGPFATEAQAAVVVCRLYGMEPPEDMLAEYEQALEGK